MRSTLPGVTPVPADLLAAGINPDTSRCKWIGSVNAPVSGSYIFYTTTDDGVMLWVDNQLIVTSWVGQGTTEWMWYDYTYSRVA